MHALWIPLFVSLLIKHHDTPEYSLIDSYTLPAILRANPAALPTILDQLDQISTPTVTAESIDVEALRFKLFVAGYRRGLVEIETTIGSNMLTSSKSKKKRKGGIASNIVLPMASIKTSLHHHSESIRALALSIICDPIQSSRSITEEEFDILVEALPTCIVATSLDFADTFLNQWKKFISRYFSSIKISSQHGLKFWNDVKTSWLRLLHPGATYLEVHTLLQMVLIAVKNIPAIILPLRNDLINVILSLLIVPFESHRKTALNILVSRFSN
ncbi:hypothetical protein BKA69DRAFT_687667 [Paraphysoderma sedebokerense]|nr:hypothetical protein BKA69DRAFT_687667 [Paraphysoderma sedebokerense]